MEWISSIKPPFGVPINRNHPLAQGLVSMWNFSEGTGDLVHDSCGMNDGKMINMAPMSGTSGWVPGPHGAALAFDRSDDYVPLDSIIVPQLDNFSVAVRVKPLQNSVSTQIVFSNGLVAINGFYLRWNSSKWAFSMNSTTGTEVPGLLEQWQDVVAVRDNGTNYIYLNGVSNNTGNASPTSPTSNTTIGRRGALSQLYFNGLISSVSIYSRALSDEEIAYLYAFPWCVYDSEVSAWEYNQQNRNFDHYYRRLMAA